MPITQKQLLELDKIYFEKPGEVTVLVGPCSGMPWKGAKIPLDGRHYRCAGKITLKTGKQLLARLSIRTHTFDFLELDGVWVCLEGTWYGMNEPELYVALGITPEQALPYEWMPDRPLDYHKKGPYPMSFSQAP